MNTRNITYTIQPADEKGEGLHQRRVRVKTCNMLDMSRYSRLRAEALDWFEKHAGIAADDGDIGAVDSIDEDTLTIFSIAITARAKCLASVDGWQELNGSGQWEDVVAPEEWTSIEGFAANAPPVFVMQWQETADRLNPGLWVDDGGEPEKKAGSVSVTS